MYRISYIILIGLFIICSCKTPQEQIVVKQIPCNESILLLRDTIKNEIDWIVVPYQFEMYKTCLSRITLSFRFNYLGYDGSLMANAYVVNLQEKGQILSFDEDSKVSELRFNTPRKYLIYTDQLIRYKDYVESIRPKPYSYTEQKQFLKPYLDSMNKLHLDTLRIGSIAEVQRTNPKFFDYFIKGDSIFINFYNKYKELYITKWLPIEIK